MRIDRARFRRPPSTAPEEEANDRPHEDWIAEPCQPDMPAGRVPRRTLSSCRDTAV
jgi:hypothetical protein